LPQGATRKVCLLAAPPGGRRRHRGQALEQEGGDFGGAGVVFLFTFTRRRDGHTAQPDTQKRKGPRSTRGAGLPSFDALGIIITMSVLRSLLLLALVASTDGSRVTAHPRFEGMLNACVLTPSAIECIDDPKQRILFRGVAAAAARPRVKEAFAVVYTDLGPVRVAGDIIFGQLQRVATKAAQGADQLCAATDELCELEGGQGPESLALARRLFDAIDADSSGGLDREELLGSPALLALLRASDDTTHDEQRPTDEELVEKFMLSASVGVGGEMAFVDWAPRLELGSDAVGSALAKLHVSPPRHGRRASPRKKANGERFDQMVETCMGWEHQLGWDEDDVASKAAEAASAGGDRLTLVLLGTFAGGHCEAVVEALRVCYEDYSPLRFGGDLIFRVLTSVVERRIRQVSTSLADTPSHC
jgi:hypothetical protein